MFRLNATLVATTRTRPWRTGWSVDRGVQVSLTAMTTVLTRPCTVHGDRVAAEPACFIDEDQASDVADITANWSKRNINIDRIEIE